MESIYQKMSLCEKYYYRNEHIRIQISKFVPTLVEIEVVCPISRSRNNSTLYIQEEEFLNFWKVSQEVCSIIEERLIRISQVREKQEGESCFLTRKKIAIDSGIEVEIEFEVSEVYRIVLKGDSIRLIKRGPDAQEISFHCRGFVKYFRDEDEVCYGLSHLRCIKAKIAKRNVTALFKGCENELI